VKHYDDSDIEIDHGLVIEFVGLFPR